MSKQGVSGYYSIYFGEVKKLKMILPKNVSYIISKLEQAGYEAYAVGGCVRDTLLGREPQDWDITTSAKPFQIKELFKKTIDTGIQHGTVTVMIDHIGYEVTTYRIDGEYEDNRHPKKVEFTDNLKLDLERRDFTINAMAYNENRGLIDEFGGIKDLKDGIIRCVGDAGQRFDEDALRMLRAVRFAGQLGFEIEKKTREAIVERASHLENISSERIRVELTKLLISKEAGRIRDAYNTGMTKYFLPELDTAMNTEQKNPHHIYTVGEHSIHGIEIINCFFGITSDEKMYAKIPDDVLKTAKKLTAGMDKKQQTVLCMAMLLHDIAKPVVMTVDNNGIGHFYGHPQESEKMAKKIMRRLTFDNDSISKTCRLIKFHDYRMEDTSRAFRRSVSKIGEDIMNMLFLVEYADVLSQSSKMLDDKLSKINAGIKRFEYIMENAQPLSIKDLAVTGSDLIAAGMKPGPKMGDVLKKMLDMVLDEPETNTKEKLLEYLKNIDMSD